MSSLIKLAATIGGTLVKIGIATVSALVVRNCSYQEPPVIEHLMFHVAVPNEGTLLSNDADKPNEDTEPKSSPRPEEESGEDKDQKPETTPNPNEDGFDNIASTN